MQDNITYVIYNESLNGYIDKMGSVSFKIGMAETFMDQAQCKVEIQKRSRMYKEVPSYDEANWKIKKAIIAVFAENVEASGSAACEITETASPVILAPQTIVEPVIESPTVVQPVVVASELPVISVAPAAPEAEAKPEEVPIVLGAINQVG